MNNYKYKFSIIMAVYNAADYLRETIDCLINQTVGFENIQLILINDGSSDNSEEICLEYLAKYPVNILYKKKKNGGPSSARNYGLKFKKGKYINFLDSDDLLPLNTLFEIEKFFEEHEKTIDFVSIPLVFFGGQNGLHPKYKYFGEKNRIIDLEKEPHNFVLSTSASFYKNEILSNKKYDETMSCEEDTKLNFTIYQKNKKFGYVCENGVMYKYRKRLTKNSITDSYRTNTSSYIAPIKLLTFLTSNLNTVPKYIQELIIYELRFRIRNLKPEIFKKQEDYELVLGKYRSFIKLVDKKFISHESKWIDTKVMKLAFITNIGSETNQIGIKEGFVCFNNIKLFSLSKIEINVRKITYKDIIKLEITYPNYFIPNLDIAITNKKGKIVSKSSKKKISCAFDIHYGPNITLETMKNILTFKCSSGRYNFNFIDQDGNLFPISSIAYQKNAFVLKNKKIKKFLNKHIIFADNNELVIKNRTKRSISFEMLSTIRHNLKTYFYIKEKFHYNSIYRLLSNRDKKYILLSDRPEKAQDNAEAVFKYICQYRKDLAKKTYFVVSKNSKDYKRLKKIGKVVSNRSIKHKILFINSKVVMCSHLMKSFFSPFDNKELDYYADLIDYKFVWLQHGIAIPDISRAAYKYKENIDYAITSIKKEYNSFIKDDYMYEKSDVLLTGMPRFDYLTNKPSKIITIIPTWREYLSGKILDSGFHEAMDGFESTEYFQNYSKLLNNKKIKRLLANSNYKIQFVLHPGMKGYFESFKKYESENIKIIDTTDVNYGKIFSESELLITDYSSVFFDFSYLRKPIIYFQFDQKDFFVLHYTKPNFSYKDDGFGDVITDLNSLIEKIAYYFSRDFKIENKYLKRIENTFVYNDKNNCKRVIDNVFGAKRDGEK